MAQAPVWSDTAEMPAWKSVASWISAAILALLFLVAGLWKLSDHLGAAARMTQALIPPILSEPAAIGFGIVETVAGVMILVPMLRRWGAILTAILLIGFMAYIGWNYTALQGEDCTCFPWVKRAVGPAFFWSDAAMLALAGIAGWWTRPSQGIKTAGIITAVVCVLAGVCYGVTVSKLQGKEAPASITVEGAPYSLQHGRVLLYFYDPECAHCFAAAKRMATHKWSDTKVIGLPSRVPQFGKQFMDDTGLKAKNSSDHDALKALFPFGDPPYGVLLEHGRQKAAFSRFDEAEPEAKLRELGVIE